MRHPTRMSIVTNLAPPYRVPVWEAIAASDQISDLTVFRMAENEPNRDWAAVTGVGFTLVTLPSRCLTWRDAHIYLVTPWAFRGVFPADAVVLSGWESPASWVLLVLCRARHVRTIGFYESTAASQRYSHGPATVLRQRFFTSVDVVICTGRGAEQAIRALGVPPQKIIRSVNPVDTAFWAAGAAVPAAARGHTFVYVGQLIERKNVSALIGAFAQVTEAEDRLVVVGSGELSLRLREESTRFGVRTEWVGALDPAGVRGVFDEAQTLVLPSTQEVWGLVVLEAVAAGLHVVVSERAGVADAVQGWPGVYVVAPTVEAIAEGMRRSRQAWRGPRSRPEIGEYGPAGLARALVDAATGGRRSRRRARAPRSAM